MERMDGPLHATLGFVHLHRTYIKARRLLAVADANCIPSPNELVACKAGTGTGTGTGTAFGSTSVPARSIDYRVSSIEYIVYSTA
ncbi:hypothetical protein V9T40_000250 [Parthenolecanium corni]|uniref:Uncharacterized protein n=1 Tax=Parthenolecanium corni TaxID=536013 RepID=A0AAN9TAQ8_9HEMI